jgi:preprotein translocase subunit SecA
MIHKLLKKIVGTRNERILKQLRKVVTQINALEPTYEKLSDSQLRAKTDDFKNRIKAGDTLDKLLPDAFAAVREASKRTLKMRPFDVQLIGGMVLHNGKIAEMRTGEGKTLVATMPAYLNALTGKAVHIITVNDYLARRDAEWMRPIYELLGLTVGINVSGLSHDDKTKAYASDVVYGTNNEFGFDYLRDNMVYELSEKVQRDLTFAIVDEVDSILIDEARTPLIISGQGEASSELYRKMDQLIPLLKRQMVEEDPKGEEKIKEADRGDYFVDEKNKQSYLTELGYQHIERLMKEKGLLKTGTSLYDPQNILLMHYVNAALRAHSLFHRDVHYIIKEGRVIIVDEHTGRLMDGRRWSDGLHQAVEAKEDVAIEVENQTLATITLQNYFRLYEKLSGMTGTADTEAFEFQKIYNLEVVVIPTNAPMIRKDASDKIYLTMKEKIDAILKDVRERVKKGQPVLLGTASIEMSELLSKVFTKSQIKHQVLNAKQHEREAKIIAQAGRPGTVTIATNMAGRGTDIVLGGNIEAELAEKSDEKVELTHEQKETWQKAREEVLQAGGLHVLGSERHEARRIDNQLRGRCGRQGDPGSSQFYLSMEDNLLRIFGANRMMSIIRKLGLKEGEAIEHSWINRSIENAQRRVEGLNFDVRKQLLEFDDVANDQRKVTYQQRNILLEKQDISDIVFRYFEEAIPDITSTYIPPQTLEEDWDISGLEKQIEQDFQQKLPIIQWLKDDAGLNDETLVDLIVKHLSDAYKAKRQTFEPTVIAHVEKMLMLQLVDTAWREHLASMEQLRQGIYLRSYAQKNPTQEFKREAFNLFTHMLTKLKYDLISALAKVHIDEQDENAALTQQPEHMQLNYQHADQVNMLQSAAPREAPTATNQPSENEPQQKPYVREGRKIGRNEPCHCGSGKKYKQCCGKVE